MPPKEPALDESNSEDRRRVAKDVRAAIKEALVPNHVGAGHYNLDIVPSSDFPAGFNASTPAWNQRIRAIARKLNTNGYSVSTSVSDARATVDASLRVTAKLFRDKTWGKKP